MIYLKQSTAATIKLGPFVDATDGVTAETGLTIQKADVRLSKNGGNMAAAAADQGESDAGAAHDELGYYDISLGTGDTDTVGRLKVMVSESGALPVWAEYEVVPANVFDSIVAGTDKLDTNAAELGGTLQSGRDIGASVLLSPGTGTGQISLSSGAVTAGTVSDKTGYGLADDAITAAKFDESTAFPLKSADTGATAVARTGADSDTLKTLSDEIAAQASELTKVPKSDGSTSWNDTALAAVAAEVEETLDSNWQLALWGDDWYDQRAAHWFTNGGVRMIWGGQTDGSDIGDVSGGNPLAAFPAGSFGKKVDDYLNYSIYSVASSVSSVLAKLGGWAGTTTDTILGAFQALFKKSGATTPADLGTVFDPATDSLPAVYDKVAALPTASAIKTELEAAGSYLEAIKAKTDNLPTDPADDSDIDAAIAALKTILDKLDTAMEADGAVYKFTKNALEDAPSGGGDDAATVAAAVWEEAKTDHTTAGTYGAYLDMAISSIGTGTGDIAFTYTMTEDDEVTPISGVTVKVSTDSDGASMIRQGITDADGEVVFNMDAGTRYFWRYKDGYYFDNPDIEVVSEDA